MELFLCSDDRRIYKQCVIRCAIIMCMYRLISNEWKKLFLYNTYVNKTEFWVILCITRSNVINEMALFLVYCYTYLYLIFDLLLFHKVFFWKLKYFHLYAMLLLCESLCCNSCIHFIDLYKSQALTHILMYMCDVYCRWWYYTTGQNIGHVDLYKSMKRIKGL